MSNKDRVKILQEGLEIIHEKFPLDSQFCLIDFISEHEIRKQKWKKAVLTKGIDLDFEVDENDYYIEYDSDTTENDEDEGEDTESDEN